VLQPPGEHNPQYLLLNTSVEVVVALHEGGHRVTSDQVASILNAPLSPQLPSATSSRTSLPWTSPYAAPAVAHPPTTGHSGDSAEDSEDSAGSMVSRFFCAPVTEGDAQLAATVAAAQELVATQFPSRRQACKAIMQHSTGQGRCFRQDGSASSGTCAVFECTSNLTAAKGTKKSFRSASMCGYGGAVIGPSGSQGSGMLVHFQQGKQAVDVRFQNNSFPANTHSNN